ncbi:hypothetical protein T11_7720 [Trichinella zimbabwensis]|uniref:Uncharacterized protein n=1 Tax=Trichinella zimbabwensis TaxID=268475 RepID=A0A0V1GC04_9BILA|nr:hypothetical protein T11_7720 [Trichinella zimbabwensis]
MTKGEKYVIRGAAYTVQEQQVAWLTSVSIVLYIFLHIVHIVL